MHIDDLVTLYMLAIEKAPAGAFYFAENGENSMREVCEAIGRMLGFGGRTQSMTVEEAAAEWGEGTGQRHHGLQQPRARQARAGGTRLAAAGQLADRGDRARLLCAGGLDSRGAIRVTRPCCFPSPPPPRHKPHCAAGGPLARSAACAAIL